MLEENSVGGGILSTIYFDLALLARSKGIHQFLLKVVNCLQFPVYLHGGKKETPKLYLKALISSLCL